MGENLCERTQLVADTMTRKKETLSEDIQAVLSEVPSAAVISLFARTDHPELPRLDPPEELQANAGGEEPETRLVSWIENLAPDLLKHIDQTCKRLRGLAGEKSQHSLRTIVEQRLHHEAILVFEDAPPGPLARSLWVFASHPELFRDAEGFDRARRHRDHGRFYSAFEVDLDAVQSIDCDAVDTERLARALQERLSLRTKVSVSVADLPEVRDHFPSVLLIARTGGPLSNVYHHTESGRREPRFFRPSEEAIMIFTPQTRQIEICSDHRAVRLTTAETFAEVVLGQDLSKKPLTWKNYDLSRFQTSLTLPAPDLDGVDVRRAAVTEVNLRLGNWSRSLSLKVGVDDDIERVAERFLGHGNIFARHKQFSRVVIAVEYRLHGDRSDRSLNLIVTEGNRSNVRSKHDPEERDLGRRLLEFWGIQKGFRQLEPVEVRRQSEALLDLLEYPEELISHATLGTLGLDLERLKEAAILERKSRQSIVVIEDVEHEVGASMKPGHVRLEGSFGEDAGDVSGEDFTMYRIDRGLLIEDIIRSVDEALIRRDRASQNKNLLLLGYRGIDDELHPIYFAHGISTDKPRTTVDIELRARHTAGPGIVLTSSKIETPYLGPNVVLHLDRLMDGEGETRLTLDIIDREFRANRTLLGGGQKAQVIRHTAYSATVIVPGLPPLPLSAFNQIMIFGRLVDAANAGRPDVPTRDLMDGTSSRSPQNAFPAALWRSINNVYLEKSHASRHWRLCCPLAS
ncbi:hypothetical protein [Pelagovum pacificum]|uniref:Uncharacterized protein n=1 Tax=Pelagovum pacificum TaxID=2588711 RepID=A0A5C5GAS2_9RHOB|nr:hypothetical protein [Pelagovum pacificum]QQA42009.1 hypothetical protein I8N54_14580 [Pelagovum pacificum]TNY31100.1 hypothetical protein FHY64_13760 [Pelagovum pacificum]